MKVVESGFKFSLVSLLLVAVFWGGETQGAAPHSHPNGCCKCADADPGPPGQPCTSWSPCSWNQGPHTIMVSDDTCCDADVLNPFADTSDIQKCVETYPFARVDYDEVYRLLTAALGNQTGAITSEAEMMMALAQMAMESKGFNAPREIECIKTQPPPESCRHPGPTKGSNCTKDTPNEYYYGRGYIHITHCENYLAASIAIFGDDRLVKDPDLVARDPAVSMETAIWFWKVNVHPHKRVKDGDFGATTKAVHGAGACTDSKWLPNSKLRWTRFVKCLQASGKFDKLKDKVNESGCYPVSSQMNFVTLMKSNLRQRRMRKQLFPDEKLLYNWA